MPARWGRYLERWASAGLIEPAAAERIRAYEAEQEKAQGLRWPVLLAISLGGLLLGAGLLLFVAAHWDTLSPAERFALVLLLVALFHIAGALMTERFSPLSSTLHAVGTAALLLRDWPQAALVAVLTPLWLSGEWLEATRGWSGRDKILAEGLLLLAISYLTAPLPEKETPIRTPLVWIGGLALIPLTVAVVIESSILSASYWPPLPGSYRVLGWIGALVLPLGLAWWLRGNAAWMNLIAALWVVALGSTSLRSEPGESLLPYAWRELGPYGMCALGASGLIAWGLQEARKEQINLGIAGFALTVIAFYFSTVMDKLGRAASLIGLGVLFLLGGWLLEKTRRRLVARLEKGET